MKIALFYEHREIGSSGFYVERALRSLGHEVDHYQKADLSRVEPKYSLYLRTEDGEYGYKFKKLRPAVYWAMDTHIPFSLKKILREAREYDFVFCCHQSGVQKLRKAGFQVEWLPVGCDPEVHGRLDMPKKYEVSAVGKEEGMPRKFFLQEIRERYHPTFLKKADFRLMREVYSASKIGFNQAINRDLNMRVFEITCAGALLITSELEDDSYERLGYVHERHLVIFKNPKDLFEKLDYYLAHEGERTAIANCGRTFTLSRHTYRQRMEALLETLSRKGVVKNVPASSLSSPVQKIGNPSGISFH